MNTLFGDVALLLQNNPWLAVPAVFLGGIMTASNPCVLAMIPLMIGLVAGRSETGGFKKTFLFSLFFVLGLAVTFTALGLISALLGRMFGDVGSFWKYALALICLVMGAHLLGLFHFNFSAPVRGPVQRPRIARRFSSRPAVRPRFDPLRRSHPGRPPGLRSRERERGLRRLASLRLRPRPFAPHPRRRDVDGRGQRADRIQRLEENQRRSSKDQPASSSSWSDVYLLVG
ncbi:MAG: cytochrome c biogenesis protein CcdA [Marinilabiliales bacterium]|nr:cytochrome c biogenesis protein CcdA [Marinilabiliales bacterium]